MKKSLIYKKAKVLEAFHLESLTPPVDLVKLAEQWGVVSIEEQSIDSDAILISGRRGYSIVINQNRGRARKQFSLAHELGHLLLEKSGLSVSSNTLGKHRDSYDPNDEEERLCDQIASEILMPRLAFQEDGWLEGWNLGSLRKLAGKYNSSFPATARRMVDLMPEAGLFGVWKPPEQSSKSPKLQWWYSRHQQHAIPNKTVVTSRKMWLIARANNSKQVESGCAPIVDMTRKGAMPFDVPAEALAWGQAEYKQIMVFYYPERELSEEMSIISKSI